MKKATAIVILPANQDDIITELESGLDYIIFLKDKAGNWHRSGYIPKRSIGKKILVDLEDHGEYLGRLSPGLGRDVFVRVLEVACSDFPLYVNKRCLYFQSKKKYIIDNE